MEMIRSALLLISCHMERKPPRALRLSYTSQQNVLDDSFSKYAGLFVNLCSSCICNAEVLVTFEQK